ncbi:MAG: DUF1186 domain-containing protein [Firmicutes bacterium]|nr:DUF1186 domain-containing protein [Bacillota bacterium]
MNTRTALHNLRTVYPRFPREELECIRANKDEAIPRLLERLKLVMEEDYAGDVEFVIFPLAEFRVREAFPLLLELLRWGEDALEQVADICTFSEIYGPVIASCATAEDIPALKEIVMNSSLCEPARSAALGALKILFAAGEMAREEIVELFRAILTGERDDELLEYSAFDCADMHLDELTEVVKGLFDAGAFDADKDEFPVGTWEDWQKEISENTREESLAKFRANRWGRRVDDCAEDMAWWACFQEGCDFDFGRKIEVNEPCPCNSGKKFKKCCMLRVKSY